MEKSFVSRILRLINIYFVIFTIIILILVYIVSFSVIENNVNNNLNLLSDEKKQSMESIKNELPEEFRKYMKNPYYEANYIDIIYNITNDKIIYSKENSFKDVHSNISHQSDDFIKFNDQYYLISWEYYNGSKYIYGINSERLVNILNSVESTGKYFIILKLGENYIIPDSIVFPEQISEILSENKGKISLKNESFLIKYEKIYNFEYIVMINNSILNVLIRNLTFWFLFIVIFIGIFYFVLLEKIKDIINKPVNIIISDIEKIQNKKKNEISYDVKDEFGKIADEFNNLYYQLKDSIKELEESEKEAKKSSNIKTQILNTLSHEIKTPLQSIIGFTSILKMSLKDPMQSDMLSRIDKSTKDLQEQVERLLERSRIDSETDQTRLVFGDNEYKQKIIDLIFKMESKTEKKNLKFSNNLKILTENYFEFIDYTKLIRILQEITDNAVKFTDYGSIKVNAEIKNDFLKIEIQDTGNGINIESLNKILEGFYQEENYLTRKNEGLGIGISIAKNYCSLMDGTLSISALDSGTLVTIMIPTQLTEIKLKNFSLKNDFNNSPVFNSLTPEEKTAEKDRVAVEFIQYNYRIMESYDYNTIKESLETAIILSKNYDLFTLKNIYNELYKKLFYSDTSIIKTKEFVKIINSLIKYKTF